MAFARVGATHADKWHAVCYSSAWFRTRNTLESTTSPIRLEYIVL